MKPLGGGHAGSAPRRSQDGEQHEAKAALIEADGADIQARLLSMERQIDAVLAAQVSMTSAYGSRCAECEALRCRVTELDDKIAHLTTGIDQHTDVLEEIDCKARSKTPRHLFEELVARVKEIESCLDASDESEDADSAGWFGDLDDLRRRTDEATQWMKKIYSMLLSSGLRIDAFERSYDGFIDRLHHRCEVMEERATQVLAAASQHAQSLRLHARAAQCPTAQEHKTHSDDEEAKEGEVATSPSLGGDLAHLEGAGPARGLGSRLLDLLILPSECRSVGVLIARMLSQAPMRCRHAHWVATHRRQDATRRCRRASKRRQEPSSLC